MGKKNIVIIVIIALILFLNVNAFCAEADTASQNGQPATTTTTQTQADQQAAGQTATAEPQKKKSEWKHKFKTALGFSWYNGNTRSLAGSYFVGYLTQLPDRWEFDIDAGGMYGEENKVKNKNYHYGRLTIDHIFGKGKFTVFYFGGVETAEFQKIYLRTEHGIGFKYKPIREWWIDFSISLAPIYAYEKTWDGVVKKDIWRWSFRPKLIIWFSKDKKNQFKVVYYYKPKIDNFYNFRSDLRISLKLKIGGIFYSTTQFMYQFNSRPIDIGVYKTDYSLITSLGIEIK